MKTIQKLTRRLTRHKQRFMAAPAHLRSLYIFNLFSMAGGIVYGTYYGIFLYTNSFSLSILAIDGLLGGLGLWLGYILGVLCVKRLGYGPCLRLAFAGWMLISFLTAFIAEDIADWFMVIAVLKSIPAGLHGATGDTLLLREVKGGARDSFLQIKLTLELFAHVMLPSLVGALISFTGGYQFAFGFAGFVYLAALFIPIRLDKPAVSLNLKECLSIFRRPLYKQHALSRMFTSSFNQLNALSATIIPFLLLTDELKVGLLTSGAALCAGIISFAMRKIKATRKVKFGYGGHVARGLASMQFVMSWTAPSLIAWRLVGKLVSPLQDPLQEGINIQNDDLILGPQLQKQALQINLLNKTLLLMGSTLGFGVFFLFTQQAHQQQSLLQTLVLSYAAWQALNLTWTRRINKSARGELPTITPRIPIPMVPQKLWTSLNWQYVKARAQFLR